MTAQVAEKNRDVWSGTAAVEHFARINGFIDAGERNAFLSVAPRVRGQAALDVGVGAGRTVPLVRLFTDDYIAFDYAQGMVEGCRRNYPGVDVRLADARNMVEFHDGQFGFVLFSFSGIDALEHHDRGKVLSEMHRVLRPGGWMMFSTHNMDGPSYGEVPWRGRPSSGPAPYRAFRWIARAPLRVGRYRRSWMNWLKNRRLNVKGDGWGMHVSSPHEFGIVLHYVTLRALVDEVSKAGFTAIEVYGSNGARLEPGADTSRLDAFYVVAQREPA
ncbi:MAG TPA: class I SAM-dependent methyltransferase [Thermoanaerobaculia bacterium]|nr:class I SAM-dependent methyltransferase [Thermoanaerobaculia bacterium]